jgi:hypothetical protein
MNKKLLSLLAIVLSSAFNAKANLRINNRSKHTAFVFVTQLNKPRRVLSEIQAKDLSIKDMSSAALEKYSYLHRGTFDGIIWYQVSSNGKLQIFKSSTKTAKSSVVGHFTIYDNGSYMDKDKKMKKALPMSWKDMTATINSL